MKLFCIYRHRFGNKNDNRDSRAPAKYHGSRRTFSRAGTDGEDLLKEARVVCQRVLEAGKKESRSRGVLSSSRKISSFLEK